MRPHEVSPRPLCTLLVVSRGVSGRTSPDNARQGTSSDRLVTARQMPFSAARLLAALQASGASGASGASCAADTPNSTSSSPADALQLSAAVQQAPGAHAPPHTPSSDWSDRPSDVSSMPWLLAGHAAGFRRFMRRLYAFRQMPRQTPRQMPFRASSSPWHTGSEQHLVPQRLPSGAFPIQFGLRSVCRQWFVWQQGRPQVAFARLAKFVCWQRSVCLGSVRAARRVVRRYRMAVPGVVPLAAGGDNDPRVSNLQ
jgi:hypothetical protein